MLTYLDVLDDWLAKECVLQLTVSGTEADRSKEQAKQRQKLSVFEFTYEFGAAMRKIKCSSPQGVNKPGERLRHKLTVSAHVIIRFMTLGNDSEAILFLV